MCIEVPCLERRSRQQLRERDGERREVETEERGIVARQELSNQVSISVYELSMCIKAS